MIHIRTCIAKPVFAEKFNFDFVPMNTNETGSKYYRRHCANMPKARLGQKFDCFVCRQRHERNRK